VPLLGGLKDEIVERFADLPVNTEQSHEHNMGMFECAGVCGFDRQRSRVLAIVGVLYARHPQHTHTHTE